MLSLPPVQVANHEVAVVTHGKIQTKLFQFSLFAAVWQDQVGIVDRAWIEPPMFMAQQFAQDGNI